MTTFNNRQEKLQALKNNMAKQAEANAAAPKFNANAAATETEKQAKAYKDAVDKKIEKDFNEKIESSETIHDLTKKNAKFEQLLEVAAVNEKFAVCNAQNNLAKQYNSDLPSQDHIDISDCNAIHCQVFNNEVTAYNAQYAGDIKEGVIIAHEFACI